MEIFLLILLLLDVIADLSSSIFIIVSLAAFQRKNIAPLNRILISLSVSNVFYTIFSTAFLCIRSILSYYYSVQAVFYFISFMTMYSILSSLWLTAILCFFYLMKIVPSQPGVLFYIKNKIGSFVLQLILMAEIVSAFGSFLSITIPFQYSSGKNSTMNEVKAGEFYIYVILTLIALAIIVIISTTVASACFLRLYNSQMKKNNGTLANTNVKDYRSAVQTMTGLLIIYLLIVLALTFSTLQIFSEGSGGFWMCSMILLSFPSGQSIFLIYGNPKLKQILRDLFTSLTCGDSRE